MNARMLSKVSVGAAIIMLLTAPLHAVAYLRTPDGEAGVIEFHDNAYEAAPGLWNFASRQEVYLTYGRITSVMLVLALLGIFALHALQKADGAKFEKWAFRAFTIAFVLLSAGALIEYFTPFLEEGFVYLALPGLALTLITGLVYGLASIRRGVLPKGLAIFLALSFIPGVPLMVALLGHIPVGFSLVMIALILVGLRVSKAAPAASSS